jgi:methyltransferase-like protein/2-polyprenyl-3-methyl-5-hydroxy-6-metoxy-1,4-benzoquinol methylase
MATATAQSKPRALSPEPAPQQNSYDQVPYPSYPFPQTHPDRLATIATLFGMQPANVENCRVLEIGCASGGNLIPMAELLPESRFLGIDASARQVEMGQKVIEELGFKNVRLQKLDIRDVNLTLGQFDYIICHGVFSWVPRPVQDKILTICRDHLSPHGVAYVSYNTFPGWHMRGMIRDMMGYHAKRFADPAQRVAQARALLDFMAQAVGGQQTAHSVLLKTELEALRQASDSYLFHEQLEETNDPLYFHQFVERAATKGLQYLGEAEMSAMWLGNLPEPIAATLRGLSTDLVQMEQFMDFLRNRMFRQTLLCHKNIQVQRWLKPEHLKGKYISALLEPARKPLDVTSNSMEAFRAPSGITICTSDRIMKAALLHLHEVWPQALTFETLLATARQRLDAGPVHDAARLAADADILGNDILKCFATGTAEVSLRPSPFGTKSSKTPLATRVARRQAEAGNVVTNLRHHLAELNDLDRHVLRHLDGQRGEEHLVAALVDLVGNKTLVIQSQESLQTGGERVRSVLTVALAESLARLRRHALWTTQL